MVRILQEKHVDLVNYFEKLLIYTDTNIACCIYNFYRASIVRLKRYQVSKWLWDNRYLIVGWTEYSHVQTTIDFYHMDENLFLKGEFFTYTI